MNNQAIITSNIEQRNEIKLSLINWVNNIIKREEKNSLGITLMYVMVGTGVASLTAALSVSNNILILMITTCLAMGTNASILSQQKFKISSWLFIISILINTGLLIYQIAKLSL